MTPLECPFELWTLMQAVGKQALQHDLELIELGEPGIGKSAAVSADGSVAVSG